MIWIAGHVRSWLIITEWNAEGAANSEDSATDNITWDINLVLNSFI